MHIISSKALKQFWEKHPHAEPSLRYWYKITQNSHWQHFDDLRNTFPSADLVGQLTVFNIGGNKYRLITKVVFAKAKNYSGRVYIRAVLTHREYDQSKWKQDPWL